MVVLSVNLPAAMMVEKLVVGWVVQKVERLVHMMVKLLADRMAARKGCQMAALRALLMAERSAEWKDVGRVELTVVMRADAMVVQLGFWLVGLSADC